MRATLACCQPRRLRALDLRGRLALVTGGTRGLGFALAEELARQGAHVAICGRSEEELGRAARALRQYGTRVVALACDVGNAEQVNQMVDAISARLGPVDVLANNAGIITVGPIETQTRNDFDESMRVMYWGVVHATLAVLPQMRARKSGRIVTITSIGGKVSVPHLLSYGSAKFAAVGFSEGLSAEVAGDGIAVTTVVPDLLRAGSCINSFFKGRHRAEYTWVSLSDSLPLLSMSARRAARQIVWATRLGRSEVVLSLPARLIVRFHGLFSGTTTRLLAVVNRVLPPAGGIGDLRISGSESENAVTQSFLTALSQRALRRYLQLGAQSEPGSPLSRQPHEGLQQVGA